MSKRPNTPLNPSETIVPSSGTVHRTTETRQIIFLDLFLERGSVPAMENFINAINSVIDRGYDLAEMVTSDNRNFLIRFNKK